MKISLLQIKQNILYDFQNMPRLSADIRKQLADKIVHKTIVMADKAASCGCDYIITPEAVNFTGTPVDETTFNIVEPFGGPSFDYFSNIAKQYSVNICAGLYNMRDNKIYNSAVMFGRNGDIEYVYDKVNLAGDEKKMITSGQDYLIIDSEFGKIAPLVCWDMQCGAPAVVADMGADIIFCPTWGWENQYGIDCAAKNHINIAAAMGIPYLGDITGVRTPSEILDRKGNIIAIGSYYKECIMSKEIFL